MTNTTDNEINKIIEAWQDAKKDLVFEIETPFLLTTKEKSIIKYSILVKHFGSKLGTIIFTTNDMERFNTPNEYGYYSSALNPCQYQNYDRETFIETLTDWGFYGQLENKPPWYNGHIYNGI